MADIPEALRCGMEHHRAGRLAEAEQMYRQVLATHPRHAGAVHLLGLVAFQNGKHDAAVDYLKQAIEIDALQAPFSADLGEIYRTLGKIPEAIAAFREALRLDTELAEIQHNLGTLLQAQGSTAEATACFREAIRIAPQHVGARNNLGIALQMAGKLPEAAGQFIEAVRLQPDYHDAQYNLGNVLLALGKTAEAATCLDVVVRSRPDWAPGHCALAAVHQARGQIEASVQCYRRALELDPKNPEVWLKLGTALWQLKRNREALECYQSAIEHDPSYVPAYLNLGIGYRLLVMPDQAIAAVRRALELEPESAKGYSVLACALQTQGDMDGAIAAFRRAVELNPGDVASHSDLIYTLNFHPLAGAASLLAEHRDWARRHAEPLTAIAAAHDNDRASERRLRVGYVTSYFCLHGMQFFMEPVIAAHDHQQFEIFCYGNVRAPDAVTSRFQSLADQWRSITGVPDAAAAQMVRQDKIDILVDLDGHIGGNRLLVFAHKPAPVQVTYMGYQNTTGMSAMDYRITDRHSDPPGMTDAYYTERLVRLPGSFFCFQRPERSPEVNSLPALASGHVTFGSLNNIHKLRPEALRTWARILSAVPHSRLILLAYTPGQLERNIKDLMAREGIAGERVRVVNRQDRYEFLELHHEIDISLDTFPFNGHTTVLDALWMGVPSIMLEGDRYASRYGGSALVTLGLEDLIARTTDQYIEIAATLAGDLERLAGLRRELRTRMQDSTLMDAAGFTRELESAYRQMWREWCAAPSRSTSQGFGAQNS